MVTFIGGCDVAVCAAALPDFETSLSTIEEKLCFDSEVCRKCSYN